MRAWPTVPRRNAAAATSETLIIEIACLQTKIEADTADLREGEKRLPGYAGDPAGFAKMEAILTELRSDIDVSTRTLSILEAQLAQTLKGEERADVQKRVADQDKDSQRLSLKLAARYNAAVSDLVAVLRDIDADNEATTRISFEAREHGLHGVLSAEFRVRKDFPGAIRNGFGSLVVAKITGWDGNHAWWRE